MISVSIIITTKNEEKNIGNCLKSIKAQSYPQDKVEIIVVDNNSTDKTKEIVLSFCHPERTPDVNRDEVEGSHIQFFTKCPERSAQRNFGVAQAKGDWILYLDADMILSPEVIKECVEKISPKNCHPERPRANEVSRGGVEGSHGDLIGLYIPEIIMGNSYWCKVRRLERSFYNGTVIDAVRFVQKAAFIKVHGFDETMSGPEDWDFDKKIRQIGQVDLISSPLYHNESEFNLKKYLAKKLYYAQSFDKYINKWGKNDPDLKKQLGFWYRFFGVFVEDRGWEELIRHPLLAFGMYFLRLTIGLNFLIRNKNSQLIKSKKGILIISPFFSPNIGGVETHLDDLIGALDKLDYRVYVHTYSPITTPGVKWIPREVHNNIYIRRYRWFGKTLLHKLEKIPFLDFLYINPYLCLRVFIFFLLNHQKIDIIHAQGFNAAFIGKYLKKIFKKKLIVSTHALYEVSLQSKIASFIKWILSEAEKVLALSRASYNELLSLGIDEKRLDIYRYWIDLNLFKPLNNKKGLRIQLKLSDKFTILFIGRLTEIKGVKELVGVAKKLPFINFVFIGNGPLENYLNEKQKIQKNIIFLGRINNEGLPKYYNMADILCIPSQYEEGFGRVTVEAVACGIPVVGSNKGGLSEALDDSVSILVKPTIENLTRAILQLYNDRDYYTRLKSNCRAYAEKYYSNKNAEKIIKYYR